MKEVKNKSILKPTAQKIKQKIKNINGQSQHDIH